MEGHRRTRSELEIESRLQQLNPESERYRVLLAARDFRASWVQLGELLTFVREREYHKEWGYDSFEAYCRRELRLRRDTALKLTRSFSFLRDHEPAALEQHDSRQTKELPPLDVVDLLSRARERAKVSDQDLATIQEEVFSPDGPSTRAQVVRRFRQVDPEAFKGPARTAPPKSEGLAAVPLDVRKALLLAERLFGLLETDGQTPAAVRSSMGSVVEHLRGRFEQFQEEQARKSA